MNNVLGHNLDNVLSFIQSASAGDCFAIENAITRRLDQLDEIERRKHLQAIAPMIDDTIKRMEYHKSGQAQRDLLESARLAGRLPDDESSPMPAMPTQSVEQVKEAIKERTKRTLGVSI